MNIFTLSRPVEIDIQKGICKIEGVNYPAIGFGTYPLTGQVCREAVELAMKMGYRVIDTATYYTNFDGIAKALKKQDRSKFYLISKVWHDQQLPEDLRKDIDFTLEQLEIDYLDAYLLHWPNSEIPIELTLKTMDALRRDHKIRHIGLSNISVNHLKRALEAGITVTWVQVEMHPHFYDAELIKYCQEHAIAVQAWAPLGRGRLSQDPLLVQIGKKYGKTSSQVALRWIMQHGCMPLPGSKNEVHIRENMDICDFMLSADEMECIDQKAKTGKRERFTKEDLGFSDELDFSYEECWPKVNSISYSIEKLPEKYFIGLELRTNNQECSITMPAHKERFFHENIPAKIPNKVNGDILAVYTDYEGDYTKSYSWILGCEVSSLKDVPPGLVGKVVSKSSYAVFTTHSPFPQGLIATWQTIWKSPLARAYTTDFEIYRFEFNPETNPEVKVYIALP